MWSAETLKGSASSKENAPHQNKWEANLPAAGDPPGLGTNIAAAIIALLFGAIATWLLNSESGRSELIVILGPLSAVGICFAAVYTRRHKDWLIVAMALMEVPLAGFLEGTARSGVHYGLLVLFCIPCIPDAWRSNLWRKGTFRLYVIYFAWAFITVSWSLAPTFSIVRLTGSVLFFCALISIVANVRDGKDVSHLIWRYLETCGFLVTLVALSAVLLPHSITWSVPTEFDPASEVSRFQGIFDNPNAVGGLMLNTVTPILAFWTFFHGRKKVALSLVMVLALGTAALADSRSPFVALAVGCLLYVVWRYRLKGLVILLGVLVLMFASLSIFGRYLGDYIGGRDIGTLTGRTDIWAFAVQQLREHPITGYGYQVAGAIFNSRYFPVWYGPWDEGPNSSLHNGYLAQAVGVGIPAAIFWLFMLLRPFVFVFSRKEDPWNLKPVALLVMVPMLVLNLTEAALGDFVGLEGILFGLTWAAAEIYRLSVVEQEKATQKEALAKAPLGLAAVGPLKLRMGS